MYTGNAMQQIIMIPTETSYTVRLRPDNQWMILESKVPWDLVEQIYESHLCMDNGRNAKDTRLAFTLLYVKSTMGLSQRAAIDELQENHYIQHFAGYNSEDELPHLVPSDVVEFEKRFSVEDLALNQRMHLHRQGTRGSPPG